MTAHGRRGRSTLTDGTWAPVDPTPFEALRETVIQVRPLTREEAAQHLRLLARNGGIPGYASCAALWGWTDEGGPSRARRLVLDRASWADPLLHTYLSKNRLSERAPDVVAAQLREGERPKK